MTYTAATMSLTLAEPPEQNQLDFNFPSTVWLLILDYLDDATTVTLPLVCKTWQRMLRLLPAKLSLRYRCLKLVQARTGLCALTLLAHQWRCIRSITLQGQHVMDADIQCILEGARQLHTLNLDGCPDVTLSAIPLPPHSRLQALSLAGTGVSDDGMIAATLAFIGLRSVDVEGCILQDWLWQNHHGEFGGGMALASLPFLETIRASRTRGDRTEMFTALLQRGDLLKIQMADCQILNASLASTKDHALHCLTQRYLHTLDLSGVALHGYRPWSGAGRTLRTLVVSFVADDDVVNIASICHALESLSVSCSDGTIPGSLTAMGLEAVAIGCPELTRLAATGTELDDAALAAVAKLKRMTHLAIVGAQEGRAKVTDCGVLCLKKLHGLRSIALSVSSCLSLQAVESLIETAPKLRSLEISTDLLTLVQLQCRHPHVQVSRPAFYNTDEE
jgi:hypothetical protein